MPQSLKRFHGCSFPQHLVRGQQTVTYQLDSASQLTVNGATQCFSFSTAEATWMVKIQVDVFIRAISGNGLTSFARLHESTT
jgi:hypothetical protein